MRQPGFLNSLGSRLTIAFVGVIVVAMGALAALVPALARAHQLAALENRLAAEAQIIAETASAPLASGDRSSLDALAKRIGQRSQTRITIVVPDGIVVGESHQDLAQVGNHASRPEIQQALAGERGVDLHYSETVGYAMLYVAVPIHHDGAIVGAARTALPIGEVDRLVDDLTRTILLVTVGAGILAVVVAFIAARAIARPLADLTRHAAVLANDPTQRANTTRRGGPAEVVQLGKMLDRLAAAVHESLQRVAAERDRLDAILANLADGIVIADGGGRVVQLNPSAANLLGVRASDAPGRTVAEVFRDHELIALVERARIDPSASALATAFLEWRNPRRFLRAAASRFETGEGPQVVVVLQDLTELRRLETVRRDFVANVSHELRTPLASIVAMVETLEDGALDDPPAARDFVTRIHAEADRLRQIVEELLHLSRIESGQVQPNRQPVAPADLLRRIVERLEPMATRAQLSLTSNAPDDLPPVAADAEQIEQVLVNLVHNAIKFTPAGGRVTLDAVADGDGITFSVADTGVGIAPELLTRIFERFYKTDQARSGGGTGLGLAIAKHIIQAHGGRIWAVSEPDRGATFFFTLPRAAHAATTPRM